MTAKAQSRLSKLVSHFLPSAASPTAADASPLSIDGKTIGTTKWYNIHTLSPAFFLPRAASIEPDAPAIYHKTANNVTIRRTYQEFADRARGFAYYVKKKGYSKVGILCTNTPAFLEALFGIGAAGAANVAINYRLKADDIAYIFDHSDSEAIVVDAEFRHLLDDFVAAHPNVPLIIDTDTDQDTGEFDKAILEGWAYEKEIGANGWEGLEAQCPDELAVNALAYTSGTTARPKGVEYTHRGCYMGALGNVVEAGLAYHDGRRCKYLWTLPMFHATGWTFPWAVTSVRGTHYCLRKIDYPEMWRLLKEEGITHYCAAPTVNTLLCNDSNSARLPEPVRVIVAASPPTAHLFEMMTERNLHPVHVYGLTETYGPITKGYYMPAWDQIDVKDKYANMARQGHGFFTSLPVRVIKTDVEYGVIEDVEKNGQEIGEIAFIGNICARGYYKDETATRKLFAGGVLHSGDLAVWHPDGAVQILDRAKDIIISGGENISSVAVESRLVTHPDILEAGVVSVQDEKWGERPKAFVTIKAGASLTGEDVIQFARNHPGISKFMVPREVEVVEELPKTSTGKIKKNVLRAWAKGGAREMD